MAINTNYDDGFEPSLYMLKADWLSTQENYSTKLHACQEENGDPYRIRTDVNGVRGRCLNHLTNGPWCTFRDSNPGPTD